MYYQSGPSRIALFSVAMWVLHIVKWLIALVIDSQCARCSEKLSTNQENCHDPCVFNVFFWFPLVFLFLVSSLFSFIAISCFPQFPQPLVSPPSPVSIILRCLSSVFILSSVFSLPLSLIPLSDPHRHAHSLPWNAIFEFLVFLPSFCFFCSSAFF